MNNITELPKRMSYLEAYDLLMTCHRLVLDDRAFGDQEIHWEDDNGNEIAGAYKSFKIADIWFSDGTLLENCGYDEIYRLIKCGARHTISRNDSMGDYE